MKNYIILKTFPDFVVFSAGVKERSKDCIILKSSWILLFLLNESKIDKTKLHYSEKFPDFVVSFAGSKRTKKLHDSEKFPNFVLSSVP